MLRHNNLQKYLQNKLMIILEKKLRLKWLQDELHQ